MLQQLQPKFISQKISQLTCKNSNLPSKHVGAKNRDGTSCTQVIKELEIPILKMKNHPAMFVYQR